jgi:hypothetical protein
MVSGAFPKSNIQAGMEEKEEADAETQSSRGRAGKRQCRVVCEVWGIYISGGGAPNFSTGRGHGISTD